MEVVMEGACWRHLANYRLVSQRPKAVLLSQLTAAPRGCQKHHLPQVTEEPKQPCRRTRERGHLQLVASEGEGAFSLEGERLFLSGAPRAE
jgi:hypothetical protein